MTDREHRIDTGSPEERVKAKWPDAKCVHFGLPGYIVEIQPHVVFCEPMRWTSTEAEAWADAAARLEDQMTASDHLKQRLATGSLGGDQDQRDVSELIAENERLKLAVVAAENRRNATIALQLEAALAQKTRECEELTSDRDYFKREAHANAERLTELRAQVEQLGRQVAEMRDQNFQQQQQLDARVQDIQQAIRNSGKLMDHITALKACIEGLLSRHKDGSDQQYWAEWDTAVDLLASRARTKRGGREWQTLSRQRNG